ncbi:MAG: hypothetical protein ACOY0T_37680 [Myxococcota bacterium]
MKRGAVVVSQALLALSAGNTATGCGDDFRTCERLRTCVVPDTNGGASTAGGVNGTGGLIFGSGGVTHAGGGDVGSGGSGFGGMGGEGAAGGCLDGSCSEGGQSTGAGGNTAGGNVGAQEGGAAGAPINPVGSFRAGPCVVSPDGSRLEVFARGQDSKIYRAVATTSLAGLKWESLPDLDGSLLDNRSDLDCSGTESAIDIAALALTPRGAYLHASGTGRSYNPFVREFVGSTFAYSPSLSVQGLILLVGISGTIAKVYTQSVDGQDTVDITPIPAISLASSPDTWWQTYSVSDVRFIAGFEASGTLALHMLKRVSGHEGWLNPVRLPPPAGTSFEFSPTVCSWYAETPPPSSRADHLVAVAGGRLWHASAESEASPFSAWEQMSETPVASSPDCALTQGAPGGVIHVVALSESGTILDVHGTSGSFESADLGSY